MSWVDVVREEVEEFADEHDAKAEWLGNQWVTLLPQGEGEEEWETDVDELVDEVEDIVDRHRDELPGMHVEIQSYPFDVVDYDQIIRLLPQEIHERQEEIEQTVNEDINDKLQ